MSAMTSRDVENVMRSVFRRCLKCDTERPSCSGLTCKDDEICVQTPPDCDACAFVSCQKDPNAPAVEPAKGPNVGAIAGGVVGGVAFVAILVFVVWKFCLKGRRQQKEDGDWQEADLAAQEKANNDFVSRRSTRASTHTVASMASSVLTRASNIIQIAYIPGVTNRSGPGSPDLLVPPVPPIPAMSPTSGTSSPYSTSASEQHFFVPDFRDSMASNSTDARTSYARTSIAPSLARASVASTVYRQNAIVSPLPAQTIVRGKAAVVSVKSTGSNSPTDTPVLETPPVPQIDPKHSNQPIRIQMPRMGGASSVSPQSSIRSTATLGPVRSLNIVKKKPSETTPPKSSGSGSSASSTMTSADNIFPSIRPLTQISIASSDDGVTHARARRAGGPETDSESEDDEHSRARRSLLHNSFSVRDSDLTEIQDTPTTLQSPFSDASSIEPSRPDILKRHTSTSSRPPMTPIVEESSKRVSRTSKRAQSPFSDDNRSDL